MIHDFESVKSFKQLILYNCLVKSLDVNFTSPLTLTPADDRKANFDGLNFGTSSYSYNSGTNNQNQKRVDYSEPVLYFPGDRREDSSAASNRRDRPNLNPDGGPERPSDKDLNSAVKFSSRERHSSAEKVREQMLCFL